MRCIILTLFCFFVCLSVPAQKDNVDTLFNELDKLIENRQYFVQKKIDRVNLIKEELNDKNLSKNEIYHLNNKLYNEYESFIYDSASLYINKNIKLAQQLKNENLLNECLLKKTHILAVSGLYPEALNLLKSVRKSFLDNDQLIQYYNTYENIYLYQTEYTGEDEFSQNYLKKANNYRDSILQIVTVNTYEYVIIKAPSLIDEGKVDEAIKLMINYLPRVSSGTRNYSVLTSILAFAYQVSHQTELQKIYLLKSAISDIKANVKETNSIRVLAETLYHEGQTDRAYRYVEMSIEDANFYNARLRNLQASKMLPIIYDAYQKEKDAQQKKIETSLIIISILSFILILVVIYVLLQMKRLAKARHLVEVINVKLNQLNVNLTEANNYQSQTNGLLMESNSIKEEYIGRFLDLCSSFIDAMNDHRKMLNKLASNHKMDELFHNIKSSQLIDDELEKFYMNFDIAFLNIFPDFVHDFNKLLPEEEKIIPKQEEKLTAELRIFALIRLGITDSQKIASILRLSITTIYTYRSKLKSKSFCKNDFEQKLMRIGSFKA